LLLALVITMGCAKKDGPPDFGEATSHLHEISQAAKRVYLEKGAYPAGDVGLTPAARCCASPNRRCAVDAAGWQHPVWKALGFSVTKPQSFQYSYRSDGKTFSATAVADRGCDGTTTTYEYRGRSQGDTLSGELIIPPPGEEKAASSSSALPDHASPQLSPKLEAKIEETDRTPIKLTFGWHAPCRVPVLAETEKRGKAARARMVAVLASDGDRLGLRIEKLEILEVNGYPADSPAVAPHLAMAQAMMAAGMPTRWVSPQGEYLGIDNLDGILDAVTQGLPKTPELTRAMQAMKTPMMRAMMEQNAGDQWNTWVGMWIGLEIAPGGKVDRSAAIELPDGTFAAVPSEIQHRGTIEGGRGLVLLESTQLLEGPAAAKLMTGMMKNMSEAVGGAEPPAVKDLSRQATILAAVDAKTSRVHRVRTETTIKMGDRVEQDIKDFAFDWSKAEGCTQP
jgi:hypothetical protein